MEYNIENEEGIHLSCPGKRKLLFKIKKKES